MPRKRSRPQTEEKFQNAVLELVAQDGCGGLGINAVAQRAGADKVLIYRYFGDFDGLLRTVAESRQWLPTAIEVAERLQTRELNPLNMLREIEAILLRHIRNDTSTHQLARWRRTGICPICKKYTEEWKALWKQLPLCLAEALSHQQRDLWAQSCSLLALMIEAELCNEAIDRQCLSRIAEGLEVIRIEETSGTVVVAEESLPTNLL